MKKLISILLLILAVVSIRAQSIVTATVTVTNTSGTTNGMSITVNGALRFFTNNVTSTVNQIPTNSTIAGSTSNLFEAYASVRAPNCDIGTISTNAMFFKSFPGFPMVVSLSTNSSISWGNVTFSTNTLTSATLVRVPFSLAGALEASNVENGLALFMSDTLGTNTVVGTAPMFTNFVNRTNAQTISGADTFTGANVYSNTAQWFVGGFISNAWNSTFTARGTADTAITIVLPNAASGNAILVTDHSGNPQFFVDAFGDVVAPGTLVGNNLIVSNTAFIPTIDTGVLTVTNQMISGLVQATTNIVSKGPVTAASGIFTNGLYVPGLVTNLSTTGTNILAGIISFPRTNNTSLANGANAGVSVGTNVFVKVSGPSGAFTINGIAGGVDGRVVILENATGFTMTIANDSGVEPTAANRMFTGTGADANFANNPGIVSLIYDSASTHWVVTSHN